MLQLEVFTTSNKKIGDITVHKDSKIRHIKENISGICPKLKVERQSIRAELKGKDIKDDILVNSFITSSKNIIYVKDLGPQISWITIFLLEYFGPLVLYGILALRPSIIYGEIARETTHSLISTTALICWSFHYTKRILETLFIHRFSHGTMPLWNLFRNCGYYWGFTLYVAFHTNHPLFTSPPWIMQVVGFALFLVCELGNFSVHLVLRDLRPAGTKVRKIPYPNTNPLTKLFNLVSCPNYTYEFGAWLGFAIFTSCLPVGIFAFVGLFQMAIWALGKHRNYKKEFSDYPKERKAILPFVL